MRMQRLGVVVVLASAAGVLGVGPEKPALEFQDVNGVPTRMWITRGAKGMHAFRLERVLEKMDKPSKNEETTLTQGKTEPSRGDWDLPQYARVAGMHLQLGTVYELALTRGPGGAGHWVSQMRYYVSHSPKRGWAYQGSMEGDGEEINGTWGNVHTVAKASVNWPEASDGMPTISVTAAVTFSRPELKAPRADLTMVQQYLVGERGNHCRTRPRVQVEKGDSPAAIAARLAAWNPPIVKDFDAKAHEAVVLAAVKALNPGSAEAPKAGTTMIAPTVGEIEALWERKVTPEGLPAVLRADLATLSCPTREEAALLAQIIDCLHSTVPDYDVAATLKALAREDEEKVGKVDLDGDGRMDWMGINGTAVWKRAAKPSDFEGDFEVHSVGQNVPRVILLCQADGSYRVLTVLEGSMLRPLKTRTRGWLDVQFGAHGQEPFTMRFDGVTYR